MELKGLHASEKLALKFGCKHQISANSVNSPPSSPCMYLDIFLFLNDIPSIT